MQFQEGNILDIAIKMVIKSLNSDNRSLNIYSS
jgi:hypothetical protein